MYVHRDPMGGDFWEARIAGRGDITGIGNTRAEAIINCETKLENAIELEQHVRFDKSDDERRHIVGVFHIAACLLMLVFAGCSGSDKPNRPTTEKAGYELAYRIQTLQTTWPDGGWGEYIYRTKVPTWYCTGKDWVYR